MSLVIDLKNISKEYVTGNSVQSVLHNIDFSAFAGEMIAIVGASGSGKSTLMNIIGFLDRCTEGKYFFSGNDVSQLSDKALSQIRNQKIGFVFQSFFLLPRMTALQNVMLPLFYRDEDENSAEKKALVMLKKVGMAAYAQRNPNQLSGGQQQRIAIARALITNPEVILADEPTGALDSITGKEVINLLLQLNKEERRTIILVTHDKEISSLCQRVVTIKDGKISKE
ncbi:MAG: ABC transporter ATP-binding protein [Gammaproteobacteria bacterium]|nr:ABC transporter ATP-binding protein [Gammaproteobacteria bacterium]